MTMKKLIPLIAFFAIAIVIMSCKKDKKETFNYTEYPDYFVINSHQIDNHEEFLIINDPSVLNSVFHPAVTMDNQVLISPNDFKKKFAIGITKEFNNVCNCPVMTIKSIELIDKTIKYKYTLTGFETTGDISCDMICRPNLLIMVESDYFTSIEFYENDNIIKTINFPD